MPNEESELKKITTSGHNPAVSWGCVKRSLSGARHFERGAAAVGHKDLKSRTAVDDRTQFPASSVGKIIFTYLVLRLHEDPTVDFNLDKPLCDTLEYDRFFVQEENSGEKVYPERAKKLTARHVLSHTTGLPNVGGDPSLPLLFDSKSALGEGYSYSGEAFIYLQKVLEKQTGKDLETLAKEYVFEPLEMHRTSFIPPSDPHENVVVLHTKLGESRPIHVGDGKPNAAGSVFTTGEDFSKFMEGWLKNMDKYPSLREAFIPSDPKMSKKCGFGWHLYENDGELIAYQYGENSNTRAFAAINLNTQKASAFFTNSENGMSIADQVFTSPDLAPIGDLRSVYQALNYTQSDSPGWQETISGQMAENEGRFDEARKHFEKALFEARDAAGRSVEQKVDVTPQSLRLAWFNRVHSPDIEQEFRTPLTTFEGDYQNQWGERIKLSIQDSNLTYSQWGQDIKLKRISETEFLPEKGQDFKLVLKGNHMTLHSVQGYKKSLDKQPDLSLQQQFKENIKTLRQSHEEKQVSSGPTHESPKPP